MEDTRTKEEKLADELFMQKMYAEIAQQEKEEHEHNLKVLTENNVPEASFNLLIDCCRLTDKIEIVTEPKGNYQEHEGDGFFRKIYVDQWTTGMEGDSYSGFIYGMITEDKWLKVPFNC